MFGKTFRNCKSLSVLVNGIAGAGFINITSKAKIIPQWYPKAFTWGILKKKEREIVVAKMMIISIIRKI